MTTTIGHSRSRVLDLYRKILKLGRSWDGPEEEKDYIIHEARKRFKDGKVVINSNDASKMIREGEERLEYAIHYRIPYPRLRHANQFSKRYFLQAPNDDVVGSPLATGTSSGNSKLEEAIRRRREKSKQKGQ